MSNFQIEVKNVMTESPVTIFPETTIEYINTVFSQYDFHHIPVTDQYQNLKGIISKDDLLRLLAIRANYTEDEFEKIEAQDIMTTDVVSLSPEEPLSKAAQLFLTNRFHSLPIVENNVLVGIITTYDFIRYSFYHASPNINL